MVGYALLWTLLGPAIVALLIAVLGALEAAMTTRAFPLRRANPWDNMPATSCLDSSDARILRQRKRVSKQHGRTRRRWPRWPPRRRR